MIENKQYLGRLFCFGLGYTGTALARNLLAEGWRVSGTCREIEHAEALKKLGVEVHLFDRNRPLTDAAVALAGVDHVLSSVPPDAQGDAVLDLHGGDLAALGDTLKWIGYLSTTGVYGTRDGDWVDEDSQRRPGSERAVWRAAAEDAWLARGETIAAPVQVFRLAGIYGPGRSVFERIKAGRAKRIHRAGQMFSRIHVDDIVTSLRASMDRPRHGGIYNVCDNEPAAPADVITYACQLLDISPPPLIDFEVAELSDMALTFWADNKKVRNTRLKQELGVTLQYPDYRAGLNAIFKSA